MQNKKMKEVKMVHPPRVGSTSSTHTFVEKVHDTMNSIPDEMIMCILENCKIHDVVISFQYVNKQFYEQCKIYIKEVKKRYFLFGAYRYDLQKHELKFIPHIIFPKFELHASNVDKKDPHIIDQDPRDVLLLPTNSNQNAHSKTFQHDSSTSPHTIDLLVNFIALSKQWRKGMNNFKYHSMHMPYDSLYAYPILLFSFMNGVHSSGRQYSSGGGGGGGSSLLFHHFHSSCSTNNSNKIFCVDLETFSCVKWCVDLEQYVRSPLQVCQTFQNDRQLIIILRRVDTTFVMSLRKQTGQVEFIYNVSQDQMNVMTNETSSCVHTHTSTTFQKWKRKSGSSSVSNPPPPPQHHHFNNNMNYVSLLREQTSSFSSSSLPHETTQNSIKKRTFDCAVLTSHHLILSVYGNESSISSLISIHLKTFKTCAMATWNRLTTTFNLTITDLENEYSQRQMNPPNRIFFDVRPQGSHVHFVSCNLFLNEERTQEEISVNTNNHDTMTTTTSSTFEKQVPSNTTTTTNTTNTTHHHNLLDLENATFEYTVPIMMGTRNLQVDFTCIGSEYWLMSGTEKQKLRTELVHLKSGTKIENTSNPLAMYMVEKDSQLVGLLSVEIYDVHEMSFCPIQRVEDVQGGEGGTDSSSSSCSNHCGTTDPIQKYNDHDEERREAVSCTTEEATTTTRHNSSVISIGNPSWRTPMDDLSKFSYQPNVQTIVLENRLYVLVSGGHGIFLYCLNIHNGNLLWKQCIIESTTTSHFSHFDVSCTLKRDVCTKTQGRSICIVGTLEEVAYFLVEVDAQSGERLGMNPHMHAWSFHERLVEQTQQSLSSLTLIPTSLHENDREDDEDKNNHRTTSPNKKCVIC
nr:unnamed protein product [Naegleria fowleri]